MMRGLGFGVILAKRFFDIPNKWRNKGGKKLAGIGIPRNAGLSLAIGDILMGKDREIQS